MEMGSYFGDQLVGLILYLTLWVLLRLEGRYRFQKQEKDVGRPEAPGKAATLSEGHTASSGRRRLSSSRRVQAHSVGKED